MGRLGRTRSFKRLDRHQRPAHGERCAARVDETEGIETVIHAVIETGRHCVALDDFDRLHSFGMARNKLRHFLRIGFVCLGVGLRRNQSIEKALRGVDRKYREIDHRRPPFFAIGQPKQKSQATDSVGSVGHIGIAAGQREAADDTHAASSEDSGLREARSLTVALEKTADAHALGMIAAETRIDSVDLLKCVGEPRRRQRIWSERSRNAQENNADAA